MRFGGHETFAIREGWLHKGLLLLLDHPARLVAEEAADWLGVGRNMAKAIRHWLVATGLAAPVLVPQADHTMALQATALGRLIYEQDPSFSELGTWWTLHVNLVHTPAHATTWGWFFTRFPLTRFDRAVCVEGLSRYLQASEPRLPSLKTLQRDVACLLLSYARAIPPMHDDPEDAQECPFTELGLLSHFRATGYYQLHQGMKDISPHIFGYAMSLAFPDAQQGEGTIDIPLHEAAHRPQGPARVFVLTSEALFDVAVRAEQDESDDIQLAGLAGERVLRLRRQSPIAWLQAYYATCDRRGQHAA